MLRNKRTQESAVDTPCNVVPHAPQFAGSLPVETQRPSHRVAPAGHAQVALVHVVPIGHALPHVPQLPESFDVLTHAPPQLV